MYRERPYVTYLLMPNTQIDSNTEMALFPVHVADSPHERNDSGRFLYNINFSAIAASYVSFPSLLLQLGSRSRTANSMSRFPKSMNCEISFTPWCTSYIELLQSTQFFFQTLYLAILQRRANFITSRSKLVVAVGWPAWVGRPIISLETNKLTDNFAK